MFGSPIPVTKSLSTFGSEPPVLPPHELCSGHMICMQRPQIALPGLWAVLKQWGWGLKQTSV